MSYDISLKNNSAENYHSNEACDEYWEHQEQVFNGLQEENTIEDINSIEKHVRLVNRHFYLIDGLVNVFTGIVIYITRTEQQAVSTYLVILST